MHGEEGGNFAQGTYLFMTTDEVLKGDSHPLSLKPANSVHGDIQLFFSPPGEGEAGTISQCEQCSVVDNFFDEFSENIR